ncbi:MAG: ABC transporter ATP-binding protein [Proteobacteria bacterium]|jgi:ABC-2 type transport system ATP-binding protein|nr:ABC transporter ATP-binding protein [Desulfocapsa sp.]MBU3946293.1 ABC transporter ATP-binding protein [Pseudomonadota bacterium]MCG2742520.1 ABC transporter ATP-binding protein [Desulfobacteraceae bacterium]MBU4028180.1 ABC transporter ATP-binding protein [Pseudomonadota bacterium]MBU4041286.1 ABC transporter ATP-binding protein [Pseudomonadota bacterium]
MNQIIEVINLSKFFGENQAVADASFSVKEGICFGLLGPNGAGKSTTMEIVEDIITASSGEILYKGQPRSASFREEIGIQFQHTSLLNFLSVEETLLSFHKLYQEPEDLQVLIERCDLTPILKRRNDQLSGGQLQRLMLALALVNRPRLVFLDEPSTGLDPQSRRNLWDIVRQIKEEGKTIIMTTHSMEEAEYLCDEVAIMDMGSIIAWDTPTRLIQTHCQGNSILLPESAFKINLDTLPFTWKRRDKTIVLETAHIPEGLNKLLQLDIDLTDMAIHSSNLEDVFLCLTGKGLRD